MTAADAPRKVLVVDDDRSHLEMLGAVLKNWGVKAILAENGPAALKECALSADAPDLAVVDMRMPQMNGLEVMAELKKIRPDLPVVIMTAYSEIADAVEAIRQGAADYLPKPLDLKRLRKIVFEFPDESGSCQEKASGGSSGSFTSLSPKIRSLEEVIRAGAPTDATILVTGASGTGKEVLAREVHAKSGRKGNFVGINCAALSPQLLESELFGYEKGAFTGAARTRDGLFAEAAEGTLFLDEIGEMPLPMQAKLLRVLQEREYLRVGGQKPRRFTGRIIAATNRILPAEVAAGRFREDLYYRLNVIHLDLPPLSERKEDIPGLARLFADRFARRNGKNFRGITDDAMQLLLSHAWPGNIRELENTMERAVILMLGEYIGVKLLPDAITGSHKFSGDSSGKGEAEGEKAESAEDRNYIPRTLQEMEKQAILKTLELCGQNKTEAARLLGISRKTLHLKLQQYREG